MELLWCLQVVSADLDVLAPDAMHGSWAHLTDGADNMPESPTHSTANQIPAPANTVPSLRYACGSPYLVSFTGE